MPRANTAPAVQPENTLSPIVAALVAKSDKTSFGEKILNVVVGAANTTTFVSGRIVSSLDPELFADGRKTEKFNGLSRRAEYWKQFGSRNGLSEADVAAIIAS